MTPLPALRLPAARRSRVVLVWALPPGVVAVALLVVALLPAWPLAREQLFEIPHGTYARRMAGEQIEILPGTIRLTLGVNDVLLLRNLDEVPQVFGPALVMPGQSFRLPFEAASTYSFACSAHASGQMSVVVAPAPAAGWPLLRSRLQRLWPQAA